MNEFLQLAVFVVLTTMLIFEGSAESKNGDERLEAKVDAILRRLDAPPPTDAPDAPRSGLPKA